MSDNELFEEEISEAEQELPTTVQIGGRELKVKVLKTKPAMVITGKRFSVRIEEIDGRLHTIVSRDIGSPLAVLCD